MALGAREGLVVLPYFAGERCPYWRPGSARGVCGVVVAAWAGAYRAGNAGGRRVLPGGRVGCVGADIGECGRVVRLTGGIVRAPA